ncbi:DUF1642 domain-containing protein [Lactiplantibacillus plantarum]|nr:DUF1642 domain-containing protein [Lactiplantibacillus plantarum]USZ11159.1 DUF1642 domain-containing protein [Lactiplantibacillus plantarum]UVE93566.1 DUF1642 domain-containing protein [Lactiplantibacillus plantarum]
MMIKVYRKTATIRAEQFDGSQTSLFGYEVMSDSLLDALTGEPAYYSILIDDVESEPDDFPDDNEVSFEIGDWIVKETDEIKVMADKEFKQQYAELPVIPKSVADWIEKCKHDGTSVGDMLCSERRPEKMRDWMALTLGTYEFNQRRYKKHQELIARAWLDGYLTEEDE